jgi:hypothetical protein
MARPVRLIPAILLALIAAGVCAGGGLSMLSPAGLAAHAQNWRADAAREPVLSLGVYVAAYTAIIAAGLPAAMVLTIGAGVIFGAVEGALAAMVAANLAALITYAAARSALSTWLARRLERLAGLAAFIEQLRTRGSGPSWPRAWRRSCLTQRSTWRRAWPACRSRPSPALPYSGASPPASSVAALGRAWAAAYQRQTSAPRCAPRGSGRPS